MGFFWKYLGPKLQRNFYPHGHETSNEIEAENLLEKGVSHVGSHGTAVAGKAMGGQAISPAFQLIYNLVQVQGLGMRSGGWEVTTETRWQLWFISSAGIPPGHLA